jgi:hypothetical protein
MSSIELNPQIAYSIVERVHSTADSLEEALNQLGYTRE